jgi:hypothetical protein
VRELLQLDAAILAFQEALKLAESEVSITLQHTLVATKLACRRGKGSLMLFVSAPLLANTWIMQIPLSQS